MRAVNHQPVRIHRVRLYRDGVEGEVDADLLADVRDARTKMCQLSSYVRNLWRPLTKRAGEGARVPSLQAEPRHEPAARTHSNG